jgi:multidrug efflux system outer membrane protein
VIVHPILRGLLTATLVLALLSTGCLVGPNYKRPELAVPDQYYAETARAEAASFANLAWWQVFDDPLLDGLVEEALKNGFDARIAAARVQEAQARYGIARSRFYPQIDYTATGEYGEITPDSDNATLWTANASLGWELDLWGRIRRLNESAKAEYLATEEARRGVLLTLAASVATAYFELRELDAELEIARRTSVAFKGTFDLFERRLQGGAASALETSRAAANLGTVNAQIPELERAIQATENRLNFLVGRNPQPIERAAPPPALPPGIPPGLPSQLLEHRPDVLQAEEQLIAANANIGVAKADFFPTLSLTGFFGGASVELSNVTSSGVVWSVGAGLTGPLFHGGRIKRQYEVAWAQWEQAKVSYEATVTNAFGEVSTALYDRIKLVDTVAELEKTVSAYEEAVKLANQRYIAGLASYFEVLEAEQQLYPAELSLAQSRRNQFLAVVQLYRALGGGWEAGREGTTGAGDAGAGPDHGLTGQAAAAPGSAGSAGSRGGSAAGGPSSPGPGVSMP